MKNIDSDTITNRGICFISLLVSGAFGFFYGIRYWENGLLGLIVGLIIGISGYFIGLVIKNSFAKLFGTLAGDHAARWNTREQLEGDMNQARHFKRNEKYTKALNTVNRIIRLDPDFPDALFLKAQILWEGFQNHNAAKSNLSKIFEMIQDENETIYQWARSLSKQIDQEIEKHENKNR